MESGERTTTDFGDSATTIKASGILEVVTKFKAGLRQKRLLMVSKKDVMPVLCTRL